MDKMHEMLKLDYDLWKSFLVLLFIISFPFGIALVVYPEMKASYFIIIALLLVSFILTFGYMFIRSANKLIDYINTQE